MDDRVTAAEASAGRTQSAKRDLLELGAAAALSLVFFAVPAILSYRGTAGASAGPAASRPDLAAMATRDEPVPADRTPPPDRSAVRVVQTEVPAILSAPAIGRPPTRAARPPAVRRSRGTWAARYARVPFVRRLVRLLAGNGRHATQPFPAVPSTDR